MPITFSHPVAILPLRKSPLIFSALVIGSMAPDFNYFVQNSAQGHFGHTLMGLFLFCLPLSLLFYALYHLIFKRSLYELLPSIDKELLKDFLTHEKISISFLGILSLSIFIGAMTHVFWDGFTHSYGWAASRWEFLQSTVVATQWGELKLYKVLQYSGHLLGVPIMMVAYHLWSKKEAEKRGLLIDQKERLEHILHLAGIELIVLFLVALSIPLFYPDQGLYPSVGKFAVSAINANVILIIGYSVTDLVMRRITPQTLAGK